jgi:hypothetical protein
MELDLPYQHLKARGKRNVGFVQAFDKCNFSVTARDTKKKYEMVTVQSALGSVI